MVDIVSEIIRAIILAVIFAGLIAGGCGRKALTQPGWRMLLSGFGLLLLACVLDVTDNFKYLNRYVVIGDTQTEAVLEKLICFLGGFVLIALGLLRWLPCLTSINELKAVASDLERANTRLAVTATTDTLTGLPNRTVFMDRLGQVLRRSHHEDIKFAVLFIDFDRFKIVNDSLGHTAGDALLRMIAQTLRSVFRDTDILARLGGDEFVVLLTGLNDWSEAQHIAAHALERLAVPYLVGNHPIVTTASVGLVTNERPYHDPGDMIRDADAAMYQAKDCGKAQVVVFDQQMHLNAVKRLSLEADLRAAAQSCDQFHLDYQPIIELDTGRLKGFEALLRWDHPGYGLISPNDFIPIAEDTGLVVPIGRWVLGKAAAQAAEWNKGLRDGHRLCMSVNVSKRQILHPSFMEVVVACRNEFGLEPGELQLEITESTIVEDRSSLSPLLHALREAGFPIAMDDFGTGTSSLSSLHEFPIDVLKIDQAFIRVLDRNRSLLAVVTSITNLADNLGIKTVAEGIESGDIIGALQTINCTWGQGYHFAKPMPAADAEAYIQANRRRNTQAA